MDLAAAYIDVGQDIRKPPMQKRRRSKQTRALEERLAIEAKYLRDEAASLPFGLARDAALRKARQAETGSHMTEWLSSPGLRTPE